MHREVGTVSDGGERPTVGADSPAPDEVTPSRVSRTETVVTAAAGAAAGVGALWFLAPICFVC